MRDDLPECRYGVHRLCGFSKIVYMVHEVSGARYYNK